MSRVPYLFCRSGNWTFRRSVPPHLRIGIGKTQVWRSLGTVSHAEAAKAARRLASETDAEFEAAEFKLRGKPPTGAELREIVRAEFAEMERERRKGDDLPLSGPGLVEALDTLDEEQAMTARDDDDPALQRVANRLIVRRKLAIRSGSAEKNALLHLLRRAELEHLERQRARLRGQSDTDAVDPLFAGLSAVSRAASTSSNAVSLGGLIDLYINDPGRNRSRKTLDGYAVIFRALKELLGDSTLARDITRDDCRRVRDTLMSLPPNATKRFKGLTLVKAAEKARRDGLPAISPRAATSYLQNLSALFRWAVQEGHVDRNPAEALRVADNSRPGKKSAKRPFDDDQLKSVFSAPLYTGCQNDGAGYGTHGTQRPRRGRFWVPLLSLFHGLRLNEACQLLASDVTERDGVPVIIVRETDDSGDDTGKRVKSAAGVRIVPVHPEIVSIGFLAFVAKQKASGEARLFPDLPVGANGYASDPFSKWFSRFLDKAGAAKPGTSFHSFRHRFRDAMREADVPLQRARALGGWSDGSSADALYGEGLRPSTLAAEIAKVEFPSLDLTHLRMAR